MRAIAGLLTTMLLLVGFGTTSAATSEWAAADRAHLADVAWSVESDDWTWPLEGPRKVLRPFVAATPRWSAGHRGVDLRAWETALRAPAAGVVRFAGWVVDRPVLSIDHGGGTVSSYEPVVATVTAGDEVRAGQSIGVVETGHCAARCVHLGVRVDGDYRNPLLWLGGVPRSVLLPTRALD